jgi:hypothetical protein
MALTNYEQYADLAQTQLAMALTDVALSLLVTNNAAFAGMGTGRFRLLIDNELLIIQSPTGGTTWTILARGAEGTTPAFHSLSTYVTMVGTRSSLLNLPRSMTTPADLESMDLTGAVTRCGMPSTGQSPTRTGINAIGLIQSSAHRGYSPMDFGAVADGTLHPLSQLYSTLLAAQADFPFVTSLTQSRDAVALQQCFNLSGTSDTFHFGKNIYIPAGVYYIDIPLNLQGKWGVTVRGDGAASILLYAGSAASGPLKITSCQVCAFDDFLLKQTGQNPTYGIWVTNTNQPTDSIVSSGNSFRRVQVYDGFLNCVQIIFDTGGDANNDLHSFEDCLFKAFTQYGVGIHGSMSHNLRFTRCLISAVNTSGTVGIFSDYGAYLTVDECVFTGCQYNVQTTNFYPGTVTINRCNSENGRTFASIGGANCPVIITANRAALVPQSGDFALILDTCTDIHIRDNNFFTTNAILPLVKLNTGAGSVVHMNNFYALGSGSLKWATSGGGYAQGGGALQITPLASVGYTIKSLVDLGNIYIDSDGSHTWDVGLSPLPNTPATVTGSTPEFNCLPGQYQRWSASSAGFLIQGMTGSAQGGQGYQGEYREIWNVGANSFTLVNQAGTVRVQANFYCTTGANIVLAANRMAICRYDNTLNSGNGGWRTAGPF